ncbi:MAG: FkbM family methyltransferase [Gammaproteobacteria bacterium]|nr:FkbM family methyltransferase [Gammaproteobacteria bacterium]
MVKYNNVVILNWMKEWLARVGIGAFTLAWRILRRVSSRPLPAKDHYYIMRFFRFFFRSYYVWIGYPNPLVHQRFLHLKVNLCENSQQWFFRQRGEYDLKEIRLIAEGMKDEESFVDIGSSVGVYALTVAQAFPDKRVIAFEPLQANIDSLQSNIARNGLTNCLAYRKAISTAGKAVRFYINPIHDGGGSIIRPRVYKTGDVEINVDHYREKHPGFQPWVEVETMLLDEVISEKCVVKIDVEGAEVDVIRSGYDSLMKGLVGLIIIEVMKDTVDDVIQLMDELQFDSFLLPDCVPITKGVRLPWFVRNIVCLKRTLRPTRTFHRGLDNIAGEKVRRSTN